MGSPFDMALQVRRNFVEEVIGRPTGTAGIW